MFLVRRAKEVMETDRLLAEGDLGFDAFLAQPGHDGRLRHVIVTEGSHIIGVQRVNTALRQAWATASPSVPLRVNPVSRASPDYKPNVSEECYQAGGLEVALEEAFDELDCAVDQLSEFLSVSRQNVVTLAERPYRLWLLSAPADS